MSENGNPLFALEQHFLADTASLGEFLLGDQPANAYLDRHKPYIIELGLSMVEARCVLLSVSATLIVEIVQDYEERNPPDEGPANRAAEALQWIPDNPPVE